MGIFGACRFSFGAQAPVIDHTRDTPRSLKRFLSPRLKGGPFPPLFIGYITKLDVDSDVQFELTPV
jgi:hypothetical protein